MKNSLLLPQNIFSKIFFSELTTENNFEPVYLNSAIIATELTKMPNSLGLIPTLDLIRFKDLFVSSKNGISFNALLSNGYLHFKKGQDTIDEIFLKGDVSTNEVILSKILFKEFYDIDIKQTLLTDTQSHQEDNLFIVGDENFRDKLFKSGLSFSEEIIELVSAPYVNFVLVSASENLLKEFTQMHGTDFKVGHSESINLLLNDFPEESTEFISVNMQHIIFDFEEQDLEGIKTLLQMPYYHGLVKDMIDVKYV